MKNYRTIGDALDASVARAEAEMKAGRAIMSLRQPLPDELNRFVEMRKHFAEAIDALLDASGCAFGEAAKREVLEQVLPRHGFSLVE